MFNIMDIPLVVFGLILVIIIITTELNYLIYFYSSVILDLLFLLSIEQANYLDIVQVVMMDKGGLYVF